MPSPSLPRLPALLLLTLLVPALAAEPRSDPTYNGKKLSAWLALLQSKDDRERRDARQALVSLVRHGRAAVEPIVEVLLDVREDRKDLPARLDMLAQLGPAAVTRLTAALWDEDTNRRALAVIALGRLGSDARTAAVSLLERLKDEDPFMRSLATEALARIGARSAVTALAERLDDKDEQVRQKATSALIHLRAEAKILVPTFIRWLSDGPPSQRRLAALALSNLGPEAASAVSALAKALDDEDGDVRQAALLALANVGPAAKESIDPLRAFLKDTDKTAQHLAAAEALWLIAHHPDSLTWLAERIKGKPGGEQIEPARRLWRYARKPEAIAAFAEMIARGKPQARRGALLILRDIGPGARAALPAAVSTLTNDDRNIRRDAITFLGRLGEHGKGAVAALEKLLEGKDRDERWWTAWALWQIQKDRRSIPVLARDLLDRDVRVRIATATLLGRIGPAATDVVEALETALKDNDARLRVAAASALWSVNQNPAALPALVQLLRDGDPSIRRDAALCLGANLGTKAVPAVAALAKASWDENPDVQCAAAEALGRIGPAASQVVAPLVALLRSRQDSGVHSSAAEALGLIGPRASSAVGVLLEKLKDHDSLVRAHAALALWRIDRKRDGLAVALAGLSDRGYRTRITAAEALWSLKSDPQAISALLAALADADRHDHPNPANARYMAARALGRIGPPARAAAPALRHLLDEEDDFLRATAEAALKAVSTKPSDKGSEGR
jgi:HEAT repeat protein